MVGRKIGMTLADIVRLRIIIGIGLSILVLVSYWGVAENDFIGLDDPLYVTENHQLQRGLSLETVAWAFTTARASNWHPLTWLSLVLDRDLYGVGNAGGYHWTNVILHLLAGLMLFLALTRMTASPWSSGLVAALFLIHPLHVESVAWVAERKDVLSGLLWMTGLWCYARYAEQPGLVRYLWVILSFTCGLLSKPMVVTFPFVLLLLDWWPLGRMNGMNARWPRLVWEKIPLFFLSAAGSIITFLIQKENQAIVGLSAMSIWDRLANAVVSYAAYMGKVFWPAGLSVFYPYHGNLPFGHLILVLTLFVLITVLSVLLVRNRPYLLVGWLWYLGTLVPVIGLVQVGSQAMADRYTYLPLIGIFIMVVWSAKDILDDCQARRALRGFVSAAVVFVLVALVVLTRIQVDYWRDTPTLLNHTLRSTERNFMAHQILAEWMAKAGDLRGAETHYREAIRIKPIFKLAYNHLGYLLMIQGKQDEAGHLFEKTLQIDPAYVPALKNLGDVRMRQGRIADAISLYRQALHPEEDDWELLNNYGVALFFEGKREDAVLKFRKALCLKPDYLEARENLQKILGEGKTVELTEEQGRLREERMK